MPILYHASPIAGIHILEPRRSNHGVPLVYFSQKRENTLVYLSNAIEKYCRETGFAYDGDWKKWGSYGFDPDGVLRIDEYYPDALKSTYRGVKGYVYSVMEHPDMIPLKDVPFALTSDEAVEVIDCKIIPDAYQAILEAAHLGLLRIRRYEDMPEKTLRWIRETINKEYSSNPDHPEYRHFIGGNLGHFLLDR